LICEGDIAVADSPLGVEGGVVSTKTTVKFTSLVSVTGVLEAHVARMRACVVAGPVTVHENPPDVADAVVTVVIGLHEAPPSRLMSMFTV
jgi:hypothetical protein